MNSDQLRGRVAVVTGGSTLVGHGTVRSLHRAGARVVILDIDGDGGRKLVDELGDGVEFVSCDITDDAQVMEVFESIPELDILVNLAASYIDEGPETCRSDWLKAIDINVVSAAICAQVARPKLAASQAPAIVNFTSISSKIAQAGRWVYPATKAAMVQLTRSMAMDYACDGIRVNSVSPGWTWSKVMDDMTGGKRSKADGVAAPFHLTGRVGDPDEVGRVVAFLASEQASVVTGADWAVDGGYSAMGPERSVPEIPRLAEA